MRITSTVDDRGELGWNMVLLLSRRTREAEVPMEQNTLWTTLQTEVLDVSVFHTKRVGKKFVFTKITPSIES